jgi:hypothetical protein
MKANCDHCGKETTISKQEDTIAWCLGCIKDNWEMLKDMGVSGTFPPLPDATEDYLYTLESNIEKLKTIPRKEQQLPMALEKEVVVEEKEEKFDFEKYNSVLPGRGFE